MSTPLEIAIEALEEIAAHDEGFWHQRKAAEALLKIRREQALSGEKEKVDKSSMMR